MTWQPQKKRSKETGGGLFSAAAAAEDDYTEIFGGGSRGSSIPVLHFSTQNCRSSNLDYSNIFGAFHQDVGVLPYQEFMTGPSHFTKTMSHSEKELPPRGADTCNLSGNFEEPPSEASDSSLDAMKQFNMSYLKTNHGNKNQPNGTTHVAKLHAVPGFTYFVNEPPSKQKTESGMPIPPIKDEVPRTWSFSGNIADKNNRKTEMILPRKPNTKSLSGARGGFWWVGSQSKDRSFSRSESYLKSQSFKTVTSSDNPLESCEIRGRTKRTMSSSIPFKAIPFEKSTSNGTDGSSDEVLDIISDAAACAGALKIVLEKAQESIRLAKEIRERGEKDDIQRFSNLSFEHSSKANDKKSRFDQEVNYSKKQTVKDRHERLGSELNESNERNNRLSSRSTSVSKDSECTQELLTSTASAKGNNQLNIAEVDGKSKHFLDLVDTGKNISSTLASNQAETDKSIAFLSMREIEGSLSMGKQESEASLYVGKQDNVIMETTTTETLELKEKNLEIETSIENDFRMGNAENNVYVDEQAQVSEVTSNALGSAPIKHEFGTSVGLEIAEKVAQPDYKKCIADELRHCEIKLPDCLDRREEKNPEPSMLKKTEDRHMLKEWKNPATEEEPREGQAQLELQFVYSHSEEEKENEHCSCNKGDMVQQEAWGFVSSDDAPKVCDSGSWRRTQKNGQEVETCGTSNTIQEIGVDDTELISEHEEEKAPTVPYEELMKKVVDCLDPNDKKLASVPLEGKSTKVLNKEHPEGEEHNISEETYNEMKVDWNVFGEEFDGGEVQKRIKKGCTGEDTEMVESEKYKKFASQNAVEMVQETEKTTSVHEENGNIDNDEHIGLPQKAAHENNVDPEAYVRLHDVQESHSTCVFEDHEASNSTTGTSEEFYNCDWEGNSEEIALKACKFTKLDEKSNFVQCPSEDHISSSETPGPFMAFESDGNEINAAGNGLSHEHMLPTENILDATYFIHEVDKDVDIKLKLEDVSEDQKETNVTFSADNQGTGTYKTTVEEPEPSLNSKSGDDFLYRFRELESVNEEFSFDKEDEGVDPKIIPKVENKEKERDVTKVSAVTHQATITQESEEELITGQNIQFVRSKPQKNAPVKDNEARKNFHNDLKEKEHARKIEAIRRERERDKDRIVVERAIREARERAFAEARERAERAAVARAGAEVRQRIIVEAREKLEKASAGTKLTDKASIEAKQRVERAAVERATAEARERALEKALYQKSTSEGQLQTDRLSGTPKASALKQSFSSSDPKRYDGNNSESVQRRKASLERHERIMERAAKALAEKNMRDLQAQKEQAERNRLAASVDADVKRWANGKEGNLRALLSTLQYILGPDNTWKPISLTEIITIDAVKKAYRKATLCVHPDKLQQRGASIQQKYTCEKVFDLLKAAWSKSNSEER